jgi:heme exporter protein A
VNPPAILVQALEKNYGPVPALRGIDLEVAEGEAIAVLGPNGAGKSTLLNLLSGLTRPNKGTLNVGVGEPCKDRRRARARIGLIGHETFLYPTLTARENLIFAGELYGLANPKQRADELLAEQQLEHAAHRKVKGFSRGMAQRVAIARGLIHDPAILLLDEPFTGLDHSSTEMLCAKLCKIRDAGKTIVLVSHDLALASKIADQAVLLVRGQIVHRCSGQQVTQSHLEQQYRSAVEPRS